MRTNWFKAFAIFALVVAVPFLIDRLLGRHPKLPGSSWFKGFDRDDVIIFGGFGLFVLAIAAIIIGLTRLIFQADGISDYLTLAEREMNSSSARLGRGAATGHAEKVG